MSERRVYRVDDGQMAAYRPLVYDQHPDADIKKDARPPERWAPGAVRRLLLQLTMSAWPAFRAVVESTQG